MLARAQRTQDGSNVAEMLRAVQVKLAHSETWLRSKLAVSAVAMKLHGRGTKAWQQAEVKDKKA